MRVDLHNHTTLCNHATGSTEAYIKQAIQEGIDIFGFSDHAPMDFDPEYRMHFDQMAGYEKEILRLKEKYQNEIEILLAYEVDYLPGHMDDRVFSTDVDYLIGSVHFIKEWGFDNPEYIGRYKTQNIDTIWQEYFDAIEALALSGRFDIVGHLDLIKVFNFMPKKEIKSIAYSALKAIKKSDMSIEINTAGQRKPVAEIYPSKALLEVAFELDIPITFSSDAHSVDQIGLYYDEAVLLAKEIGYSDCAIYRERSRKMYTF
jgi:histidinol-phosphatase (PHP family)